jgi:hypothetical protein
LTHSCFEVCATQLPVGSLNSRDISKCRGCVRRMAVLNKCQQR